MRRVGSPSSRRGATTSPLTHPPPGQRYRHPNDAILLTFAFSFNGGQFVGTKQLRLVFGGTPGPRIEPFAPLPLPFPEPYAACNRSVTMDMTSLRAGLFWIDVLLDDEFMTRIPIRIRYGNLDD